MAGLLLSSLHSSVYLYFCFLFSPSLYIFSPGCDRSIRGASAYRNDRHSIHVRRREKKKEKKEKIKTTTRRKKKKKEKMSLGCYVGGLSSWGQLTSFHCNCGDSVCVDDEQGPHFQTFSRHYQYLSSFLFSHERKCVDCHHIGYTASPRSIFVGPHFSRKLSSLGRLYGCRPFFSRLNEPTRSQTVASWLLILHATFFFNKLIFFVVCELYIYFVGHLDLGEGINQVFLRSLCVRMRVLCVRVLIFITIHISRPVQKRRFWHWIKKKK